MLNKYLNPIKSKGLLVAILGVDGVGKSTVINAILPILEASTYNKVTVRHLRPAILPSLSRFKGVKTVMDGSQVLNPHSSKPSGTLLSIVRLAYLILDYILGYWAWVMPHILQSQKVVVFDRYAYDIVLDPRRFRIALPAFVIRSFIALVPKPDIIFCLHGDPIIIAKRKNELSIEETNRQILAIRAFAAGEPRAILICSNTSIEEMRDKVVIEILNKYNSTGI